MFSVPTQSLYILNADSVMAAADAIAWRIAGSEAGEDREAQVGRLFELVLGAGPDRQEMTCHGPRPQLGTSRFQILE